MKTNNRNKIKKIPTGADWKNEIKLSLLISIYLHVNDEE